MIPRFISVRPSCGVFSCDADIARQSQLLAAAEGEAADGGGDRLRATIHLTAEVQALSFFTEGRLDQRLNELEDIRAGREGALAAAAMRSL
jgi:hypothetical protein